MPINGYTVVKVISASKWEARERLGETVTAWLSAHPELEVIETLILQSSDTQYHCLSCILFATGRTDVTPQRDGSHYRRIPDV
jgi:hypothetical protein